MPTIDLTTEGVLAGALVLVSCPACEHPSSVHNVVIDQRVSFKGTCFGCKADLEGFVEWSAEHQIKATLL